MEAKQYFFTYRDGLTADVLRRGGVPHKTVFGLQVPQLSALARRLDGLEADERRELAAWLWADSEVRESRLLACWLFAHDLGVEAAEALAKDVRSQEEADMLAFRCLRFLPDAPALLARLGDSADEGAARTVRALGRFLS